MTVTNKQLEILLLLYRYRFLTRTHIQQFLNHKNHSLITRWLKDLTDKQIINRIYKKTIPNINKPAIYYLATKSRSILKEQKECNPDLLNRVYREKYRSEAFRQHWLFIADLYFHFQKAAKQNNSTSTFYITTDLSEVAYAPLPDAYIVIKKGNKTNRYFLDLMDNRPMFLVRKRVDQYINYCEAGYWQDNYPHPLPKVLLICPTTRTQESLSKYISDQLEMEDTEISFFLGLKSDITRNGIRPETWQGF